MTTRENDWDELYDSGMRHHTSHVAGARLTTREIAVIEALLQGCVTYKQLAGALEISPRTVQTHLCAIFAKTGAVSLADLVLMAVGRKTCAVDLSEVRHGT